MIWEFCANCFTGKTNTAPGQTNVAASHNSSIRRVSASRDENKRSRSRLHAKPADLNTIQLALYIFELDELQTSKQGEKKHEKLFFQKSVINAEHALLKIQSWWYFAPFAWKLCLFVLYKVCFPRFLFLHAPARIVTAMLDDVIISASGNPSEMTSQLWISPPTTMTSHGSTLALQMGQHTGHMENTDFWNLFLRTKINGLLDYWTAGLVNM